MTTPRKYSSRAERQSAYRARRAAALSEQSGSRELPALPWVPTMPGYRRWDMMIGAALGVLKAARGEMEVYFEERTEVWQDSERGEVFVERMEALEEVIDGLQTLKEGPPGGKQMAGEVAHT